MNAIDLDAHLDSIREREKARDQAALLRDIASRQDSLADDLGRTARDVVHAIQSEAAHLERRANKLDQDIRSRS